MSKKKNTSAGVPPADNANIVDEFVYNQYLKGNDRNFNVSTNYFNKAYHGKITSFIASKLYDFKVGETMRFDETINDGYVLTGRRLSVIIDNIGVNVMGLQPGYCIVSFRLS